MGEPTINAVLTQYVPEGEKIQNYFVSQENSRSNFLGQKRHPPFGIFAVW